MHKFSVWISLIRTSFPYICQELLEDFSTLKSVHAGRDLLQKSYGVHTVVLLDHVQQFTIKFLVLKLRQVCSVLISTFFLLAVLLIFFMRKYLRQYVVRRNVCAAKNTAKCPTAKNSHGEMSHGEMSLRRSVLTAKCLTAKCPMAKNPTAKCLVTV